MTVIEDSSVGIGDFSRKSRNGFNSYREVLVNCLHVETLLYPVWNV